MVHDIRAPALHSITASPAIIAARSLPTAAKRCQQG
jgi:hypothetical protein